MPPGFGRNSFIGWVQESAWGTPVTPPTKFAELISEALQVIREREARPVIRDRDVVEDGFYDVKHGGDGGFVIEASYEGLLRLIEHAFGDGSVATVENEVGVRWTHTATLKATQMSGKGLTLYANTDVEPGATPTKQFAGFKINTLKLTYDPRRNVQLELSGAGKDAADVAAPTATFPSRVLLVAGHQVVCEIDDVVRAIDAAEIELNAAMDLDKRVLGAKTIAEPVPSAERRLVTGQITVDAAFADLTKYKAGTLFKLELLATGPTLGAANHALNVTALKCELTADPYQIGSAGIVKSVLQFRARKPTAGELLTIAVTNGEAAVA